MGEPLDIQPVPLLRLDGITKLWGDRLILDRIDLELRPGIVTGVVGDNGVGKTTLMRIACGMIAPDAGTVVYRGAAIERIRSDFQRVIGLLSAGDRGLYARLTVRQNLEFWAGLARLGRRDRTPAVERVMGQFMLGDLAGRRVERLSMGQRQRVRMAMTFLHDPLLVFLDEPRTSLDEAGIQLLADALDRLLARGGSALWVSHEADEPLVTERWALHDHGLYPITDEDVEEPMTRGALAS